MKAVRLVAAARPLPMPARRVDPFARAAERPDAPTGARVTPGLGAAERAERAEGLVARQHAGPSTLRAGARARHAATEPLR